MSRFIWLNKIHSDAHKNTKKKTRRGQGGGNQPQHSIRHGTGQANGKDGASKQASTHARTRLAFAAEGVAVVWGRLGGVVLAVRHAVRVLAAGHRLDLLGGHGLLAEVAEVHVGDGRLGGVVVAVGAGAVAVALAEVAGDSAVAVENRAGLLGGVVHAVAGAGAVAVRQAELAHDRRGGGGEEEEGGSLHHVGMKVEKERTVKGRGAKTSENFGERFLLECKKQRRRHSHSHRHKVTQTHRHADTQTQARTHRHRQTHRHTDTNTDTLKLVAFGCSWPSLPLWPTHPLHPVLRFLSNKSLPTYVRFRRSFPCRSVLPHTERPSVCKRAKACSVW